MDQTEGKEVSFLSEHRTPEWRDDTEKTGDIDKGG
jgi:hypothetical protein